MGILISLQIIWLAIQWNPSCEATPFAAEMWPFKRGGLSSGVEINTFMFRLTVSSGLSRGVGLLSGWPHKRGSTVSISRNEIMQSLCDIISPSIQRHNLLINIFLLFISKKKFKVILTNLIKKSQPFLICMVIESQTLTDGRCWIFFFVCFKEYKRACEKCLKR